MKEENKRHAQRVRNLVIIFALTAVIISVSTYAWFIGMRTVNVSSFDVEISSTDSLLLSLDGEKWDTTVSISKDKLEEVSYDDHMNTWGGERGLTPVSSVGEMDVEASRLILFEKASLTATHGGYRLLASRVDNSDETKPEPTGYVAFDLFIKNFSGRQYIENLNSLDEEAIYLTTDSSVKVSDTDGTPGTGIENSVRVAFAQIGRVEGTTQDADKITGIECNALDDGGVMKPSVLNGVTGICRTAQIWEPNDKEHVQDAINWYETACLARVDDDVTDKLSYSGACGPVVDKTAYPTYAINKEIASTDNVDIYDGEAYNGYTDTVGDDKFLYEYKTFTDSMKKETSVNRPQVFTLAPNSITKVRVYVYIEGQDIDNYDFAQIGKMISVQFGFTKERFTVDDLPYGGPTLDPAKDKVKPVITLTGGDEVTVPKDLDPEAKFSDPGFEAKDKIAESAIDEDDLTSKVVVTGTVDMATPGEYILTYTVSDWANNYASVTRKVIVTD